MSDSQQPEPPAESELIDKQDQDNSTESVLRLVDPDTWKLLPYYTVFEVICLLAGMDPREVRSAYALERETRSYDWETGELLDDSPIEIEMGAFKRPFEDLKNRIHRAVAIKSLKTIDEERGNTARISCDALIQWLEQTPLPKPTWLQGEPVDRRNEQLPENVRQAIDVLAKETKIMTPELRLAIHAAQYFWADVDSLEDRTIQPDVMEWLQGPEPRQIFGYDGPAVSKNMAKNIAQIIQPEEFRHGGRSPTRSNPPPLKS